MLKDRLRNSGSWRGVEAPVGTGAQLKAPEAGLSWVMARDLKPGDQIILANGKTATVETVEADTQPVTVHNIAVDTDHTYFVGETGLWAHNACGAEVNQDAHDQNRTQAADDDAQQAQPRLGRPTAGMTNGPMDPEVGVDALQSARSEPVEPEAFEIGDALAFVFPEGTELEIVLKTQDDLFVDVAQRALENQELDTVVNGSFYSLSGLSRARLLVGPVESDATTLDGLAIVDGVVVDGREAPLTFYVAHVEDRDGQLSWQFGFGDPPLDSSMAIGGAVPLVIDGLKFGVGNEYRPHFDPSAPNTPIPVSGPVAGDPGQFADYLIQRNNSTFTDLEQNRSPRTGKTAIGYSSETQRFMVVVQPDMAPTGMTVTELRDVFIERGYDNALLFDGSDSSMLVNTRGHIIAPGIYKNRTIEVGIGFTRVYDDE